MKCPVCSNDCIREAGEIIGLIPAVFARCGDCRVKILDKTLPPPKEGYHEACRCGKRFVDEVFFHLYELFLREGIFTGKEAIREVGSPLLHPGYPIASRPFLPERSFVLLSRFADVEHAREHEEGDLLDDRERVGDAARVEAEPQLVDVGTEGASNHGVSFVV